jgi:hypothetical protein
MTRVAHRDMPLAGLPSQTARDAFISPVIGCGARHGRQTLAWLKVKVPRYREGERGWEAKT